MARRLTAAEVKALSILQWGVLKSPVTVGNKVLDSSVVAAEICRLETGGTYDPSIRGPKGEYGLWQIYIGPGGNNFNQLKENVSGLNTPNDLLNPTVNAATAHYIWSQACGGAGCFVPWTTFEKAKANLIAAKKESKPDEIYDSTHEAGLYPGQLRLEGVVGSAADILGKLTALFNPTFWKWVGLGALGIFITIIATVFFTDTGQSVAKGAATKGLVK